MTYLKALRMKLEVAMSLKLGCIKFSICSAAFLETVTEARSFSVKLILFLVLTSKRFDSLQGQYFFLLHSAQTGSGAHPASYPMGTEGFYLGVKRQGREANHLPPLVPGSRMVELYLHSPICLHSMVFS
jgi:hypothetical protein